MFAKTMGLLFVLLGLGLLGWIGYNVLIEMQPAAEGRNPLIPFALGLVLVIYGLLRMRGASKRD